ncbi:TetR/AcrR family transcriptional regulator [Amycolatopsis thermoflava]|uniref:TetR/AcrR family transcriptional regulator n=1 Tax=Amycolatopsis thermoflava TaxID=84480 RepID=UPI00381BDE4E
MARSSERPPVERRNRDDVVLATAIAVMAERGYSATSVQEVADRVGVLKGSLYHYFSSKEELLFRIVESSHLETSAIAEDVAGLGLSPFKELLEWLRRSAVWYLENRERAAIFFTDRRHLTGERRDASNAWGRTFEARIARLVDAARADGEIRDDIDPRLVARFVIGTLNDVRFWPSRSGKPFTTEEMADALVLLTRSAVTP